MDVLLYIGLKEGCKCEEEIIYRYHSILLDIHYFYSCVVRGIWL